MEIKRLQEIMQERGLSQADVCRLCGIAPSVLSRLLRGQKIQVSAGTVEKLAAGLGVNMMEFLTGEVTADDTEYILLIRELEKAGITKDRLRELAEWVGKIKKPSS